MCGKSGTAERFAPDRLLEAWSAYRIGVAGALLWLVYSPLQPLDWSTHQLDALTAVLAAYLGTGVLLLVLGRSRVKSIQWLIGLQLLTDWVGAGAAVLLTGGVEGGLATLYILPTAMGGLFLSRPAALAPAAASTLALLGAEAWLGWNTPGFVPGWAMAGLLGACLFLVAWLASAVAARARLDEQIARLAASNLGQMRRLTAEVVERMHAAVIVADGEGQVLLHNAAAETLLLTTLRNRNLARGEAALWASVQKFIRAPHAAHFEAVELASGRTIWPQFVHLAGSPPLILIMMDDPDTIARQVQQTRLAAIGQITAGVAHNIRNPLAALNNAAELLLEAPEKDRMTLLPIIQRQVHRMNRVVERIYDLSRPIQPQAEPIELQSFLDDWLEERGRLNMATPQMELLLDCGKVKMLADASQLSEVLQNLIDNALAHARPPESQTLIVRIQAAIEGNHCLLAVYDNGTNDWPAPQGEHVPEGGLGLTLCRALLSANGSQLRLVPPHTDAASGHTWKSAQMRLPLAAG